jgi:hypothetical protein
MSKKSTLKQLREKANELNAMHYPANGNRVLAINRINPLPLEPATLDELIEPKHFKVTDYHEANHYRRMKRLYQKHGLFAALSYFHQAKKLHLTASK